MKRGVESTLRSLGLDLPAAKPPVANYLGTKQSGHQLFVAARVSQLRGVVGETVNIDQAQDAARDTLLQLLAIIKADILDLDRICSVVKLQGFVRSAPDFIAQPKVIDGASDLLVALYGEAGRHARTATGTSQLPYGAAIQLDMVVELGEPPLV